MKNYVAISQMLGILTVFLLAACKTEPKNGKEVPPETQLVETVDPVAIFENEYVRALKVVLEPGEEMSSHKGEPRLIYSLSDYAIQWREGDVDYGIKNWKQGDIHVHEAAEHWARNTGTTRAEWIVFDRKATEMPACDAADLAEDLLSVAGEAGKILFDNNEYRVMQVMLGPGGSIPSHYGINRLIYSLSDYTIRYESDKTGTSEHRFSKGDVHWHEGCRHAFENIGDTEVNFLVVGFK